MNRLLNILQYFGLPFSFFVLCTLQAAQISDKEHHLLNQANTYNEYKDDEKIDNENDQDELDKAFLEAAKKGDVTSLKKLKNNGANVHARNKCGNNALHLAALYAKEGKSIKWLIDSAHLSIESKGEYQNTPFLCAAQNGNLPALKILKNKGANVKTTDKYHNNALHLAAMFAPDGKGIKWLIDSAHLSIESKGQYQNTPFLCAAEKGNLPTLKILKNKGANVKTTDKYGNNALHLGALYAREGKSIKWLIDSAHLPIESKGQYQNTPFLCAAENGNLPILKILKEKIANINAKNEYSNNALHLAAANAPEGKGIKWLIHSAHLSIESKGQYQMTPFLCAAEKGNLAALKILKHNDANTNAIDKYGNNALHLSSIFAPKEKGIKWLIHSAHLSIESKGQYQKTPFLCAAEKGNLAALKILKHNGANTNATDRYGNNALHLAALYAEEGKGIKWLIHSAHLSIESKNNNNKTPFLCAAERGNLPALKILKHNGANINATDGYGNNALHQAALYAEEGKGIKWLIHSAHLSIESKNNNQKTPFLCAAQNGNLPALKILKTKDANLKATDQYGNNALHYAAALARDGNGIKWLIDSAHLSIESKGQYQKTPFLVAASKGNLPALKILKHNGANVHVKSEYGNNALHLAALYAEEGKSIKWLIHSAHLSIESKNNNSKTPFLCAAQKGNLPALKILKHNDANVEVTDTWGKNALHYAIANNAKFEAIEWLVNFAKIDIQAKERHNQKIPFLMAAKAGNLPALKILKEKGANIKATDQNDNNALYYAIKYGAENNVIEWLINTAKVPIELKEYDQTMTFLKAAEKGNLTTLKILKAKGTNVKTTLEDGRNALHLAAMYAPNGKGIEWLIDIANLSIESKDHYQKTPFLMAAEKGNLDALKIFKAKGANLNATDKDGNNALHQAVLFAGEGKGIKWLIHSAHLSIESKGRYQNTPFLCAAQKGNLIVLKLLKKNGANVYAKNEYGNNALYLSALFAGEGKSIKWLIHSVNLSIESKGYGQKTPFLCAAEKGNLPALKILKNNGANTNATDNKGNNALHYAASFAPEGKGIKWLIHSANLSIESKNNNQKTPFLCAAQKGNLGALKILKHNGANVDAETPNVNNALHLAAYYAPEGEGIAWLIHSAHLSIESKGHNQATPFLMAAHNGNLPALKILKNNGANINATDQYGNNALHFAAGSAPEGKGIKWLIHCAYLSIEFKGWYQKTPFLCAAEKGNLPALKLLKNNGANTNATDGYGNNALWWAKKYSNSQETIDWLQDICKLKAGWFSWY